MTEWNHVDAVQPPFNKDVIVHTPHGIVKVQKAHVTLDGKILIGGIDKTQKVRHWRYWPEPPE